MKYCFGIDIGGTTVKCGLFSEDGNLLDKWEIPTDTSEQGKRILRDIAVSVSEKLNEKSISKEALIGVGIDVPGPVVSQSIVKGCVNLGWPEYNVKEEFLKELKAILGEADIKVSVENDANTAALGEMFKGIGRGNKSLVMLTLGTGVGGGVVIDGKILSGVSGAAGELGHMPVLYDEPEFCNCGKKGCLEQIASATGIVRHAKRVLAGTDKESVLRNLGVSKALVQMAEGAQPCEVSENMLTSADISLTAKDVFDAFRDGDELAAVIVNDVCGYLATALAHITCVINPEIIVVGGGVSKAGTILIDTIAKRYKEKAFNACKDTPIVLAALGNDAGIYGAAGLVL